MSVTIDLTLDALKVPGIPEYTPPFGTKKGDMESLTTMEVNNNALMPFANRRPFIIDEQTVYELSDKVERDATFIAIVRPIFVDVRTVTSTFKGVELKFVNDCGTDMQVEYSTASGTKYADVQKGVTLVLEAIDNQGHFKVSENSSLELTLGRNFTNSLLTERNLVDVLGASGNSTSARVQDAFAKLQAKTSRGDFSGLGLGDYIDIPSITFDQTLTHNASYENLRVQIIAFDYFKNYYNTTHHVVMQFKHIPFNKEINSASTNTGGYPATSLANYLSTTFGAGLEAAMGIYCLPINQYFQTAATTWSNSTAYKVFLPTENQLIGHKGSSTVATDTVSYELGQFPYYAINPKGLIKNIDGLIGSYWTASPLFADSDTFAAVDSYGRVDYSYADYDGFGVAPVFCI